MSNTSYDCYYEKHFALHSLSGVKICAFEMLLHICRQISGNVFGVQRVISARLLLIVYPELIWTPENFRLQCFQCVPIYLLGL